ncbi:MAG: glycosyltransferase [Acidobacteria bacterium]|nr:glycosyltransferase [Acidobacteriota bacterium]
MSAAARRLDVVIPVLNEAHVLRHSVETVLAFLERSFDLDYRLVIVDNGSTDGTHELAQELSFEHARVYALRLEQRGRGRALRYAWTHSQADCACYMDVDLSTDLDELPLLVGAILDEGYDIAIGSRLLPQSRVTRSLKRTIISRAYNRFLKVALATRLSDAQCGFKAVNQRVIREIVPQVRDESWFFDTEMLALAERRGLRIKDLPVVWAEDDDSRVKILQTAWDDIQGVLRLRRQFRADGERVSRAAAAGGPQ